MAKNVNKMTFEERLRRLQDVVERLESAELPLEESVALYKEGLVLSRACREQLDKARNEVRMLAEDGRLVPFEAEAGEESDGSESDV